MSNHSKRNLIYPVFSKNKVNNAAKNIVKCTNNNNPLNSIDEEIIENWRASHTHVLNVWQKILSKRTKKKKNKIIFAQRLKRKNTIYDKIKRYPDMNLARMHDIAGCRLIFKNIEDINIFREELHKAKFNHYLKEDECKDYISNPKSSGYRGMHDVYVYKSRDIAGKAKDWDGLLVEIQYRTIYQHAWATAVEIVDSMNNERLKFSEGGDKEQEFFKLTSEIIARAFENKTSCKPHLSNEELIESFIKLENDINLLSKLKALKAIHKHTEKILKKNAIIIFDTNETNKIKTYVKTFTNLKQANGIYFKLEKEMPSANIVLVTSNDTKFSNSIKNAYKNYFADATDFTKYIDDGIKMLIK